MMAFSMFGFMFGIAALPLAIAALFQVGMLKKEVESLKAELQHKGGGADTQA